MCAGVPLRQAVSMSWEGWCLAAPSTIIKIFSPKGRKTVFLSAAKHQISEKTNCPAATITLGHPVLKAPTVDTIIQPSVIHFPGLSLSLSLSLCISLRLESQDYLSEGGKGRISPSKPDEMAFAWEKVLATERKGGLTTMDILSTCWVATWPPLVFLRWGCPRQRPLGRSVWILGRGNGENGGPTLERRRDEEQALASWLERVWDLALGQGKGQKQALN